MILSILRTTQSRCSPPNSSMSRIQNYSSITPASCGVTGEFSDLRHQLNGIAGSFVSAGDLKNHYSETRKLVVNVTEGIRKVNADSIRNLASSMVDSFGGALRKYDDQIQKKLQKFADLFGSGPESLGAASSIEEGCVSVPNCLGPDCCERTASLEGALARPNDANLDAGVHTDTDSELVQFLCDGLFCPASENALKDMLEDLRVLSTSGRNRLKTEYIEFGLLLKNGAVADDTSAFAASGAALGGDDQLSTHGHEVPTGLRAVAAVSRTHLSLVPSLSTSHWLSDPVVLTAKPESDDSLSDSVDADADDPFAEALCDNCNLARFTRCTCD